MLRLKGDFVVKAILKKTRARVFADLRVGDTFLLSVPIKSTSGYRRGVKATYITVRALGKKAEFSFQQLNSILGAFYVEDNAKTISNQGSDKTDDAGYVELSRGD